MTNINYRLEKKIDDAFDNFALMMQRQFSELFKITGEIREDVSVLKVDVAELKTDVAILKTDVAELKADVRDLKVIVKKHDISISDLQASNNKQDVALTEIKGLVLEYRDVSKKHEARITVLEESFA